MSLSNMTIMEMPNFPNSEDHVDTPLVRPAICKNLHVPLIDSQNVEAMMEFFEGLPYTRDVVYNNDTIFVMCELDEYKPSKTVWPDPEQQGLCGNSNDDLVSATKFFREGVHSLSQRIWRVRRTLTGSSELRCKRDMGYNVGICELIVDCCKGDSRFYVFKVDIKPSD